MRTLAEDLTFPAEPAHPARRARRLPKRGSRTSLSREALRLFIYGWGSLVLISVGLVVLFRWVPPPTTSFALQWAFAQGRWPAQTWVPWNQLSPELALAVVAAEDQKFGQHAGFDIEAINKAMHERSSGGRVRGASTITQQVAKNLFLWPQKSWLRKGIEAWLTLWIEMLWPKQRILETYVNVAEFGPGVFGAQAAAVSYFGKPAARLDRAEAALLAAVLPNPARLSAAHPSRYVIQRQGWIMAQMARLGGRGYLANLDR